MCFIRNAFPVLSILIRFWFRFSVTFVWLAGHCEGVSLPNRSLFRQTFESWIVFQWFLCAHIVAAIQLNVPTWFWFCLCLNVFRSNIDFIAILSNYSQNGFEVNPEQLGGISTRMKFSGRSKEGEKRGRGRERSEMRSLRGQRGFSFHSQLNCSAVRLTAFACCQCSRALCNLLLQNIQILYARSRSMISPPAFSFSSVLRLLIYLSETKLGHSEVADNNDQQSAWDLHRKSIWVDSCITRARATPAVRICVCPCVNACRLHEHWRGNHSDRVQRHQRCQWAVWVSVRCACACGIACTIRIVYLYIIWLCSLMVFDAFISFLKNVAAHGVCKRARAMISLRMHLN